MLSHTTVTLDTGQGHSDGYETIQFNCVYYYTKFERNLFIDVRTQSNV